MPSVAALTIYLFGLSAIYHSLTILLNPTLALKTKRLPPAALPSLTAFGVTALGIGIYYILAAWQENRTFFAATLLRVVSAWIFWKQGEAWRGIARFEGLSAILTGVALVWEGL